MYHLKNGRIHASTVTLLLACVAGLVALPRVVEAQQSHMAFSTRVGGEGPSTGKISRMSVTAYEDLLELSDDLRVAAGALFEGYDAAYGEATQARRKALDAARSSMEEDSRPGPEFFEKMGAAQTMFAGTTAKLEAGFFADLKSLLSESEVEDLWPAVERLRRREVQLRSSRMSGEGLDLVAVVQSMKMAPSVDELPDALAAAVRDYELEMDRKLEAKERAAASSTPMEFGAGGIDMEAMQKQMAASKEMSIAVKDVNDRNARKLAALIPEDRRDEFEKLIRIKMFPRVYRDSKSARAAKAAMGMSGVDEAKKAAMGEALERYQRDSAAINEAWARAIEAQEKSSNEGVMAGGGAVFRMSMGDEPKELVDARQARRDLDKKLRESVDQHLTPEQADAVTKAVEAANDADGEGEGMMMEAVQIRIGGPG